ncbi:hypothetical protein D5R81_01465 [Parashewanella spongiae]|uniref:Copper chaperone PCu(A)C n=1 Tax=Parashewanella spongiae TaxID=342950 RepID=A0A3A6UNC5_9GAMM|nr:hypothetical protein [Parashewanella spongiae]MCL1076784.1 hypothetical protein [Parashewanella spongiae]RJY19291.1 hypothetical protein D5R81_01465 [Parashewanella spongiae]
MINKIFWIFLLLPFQLFANDEPLSLDRVVPSNFTLAFPNEDNIRPSISTFKVNNFALMSNETGERWAIVTLTNQASGRRTISQKHLMALVADGEHITPFEISQSFKAGETLSLTLYFGVSKFPILTVFTRTKT